MEVSETHLTRSGQGTVQINGISLIYNRSPDGRGNSDIYPVVGMGNTKFDIRTIKRRYPVFVYRG